MKFCPPQIFCRNWPNERKKDNYINLLLGHVRYKLIIKSFINVLLSVRMSVRLWEKRIIMSIYYFVVHFSYVFVFDDIFGKLSSFLCKKNTETLCFTSNTLYIIIWIFKRIEKKLAKIRKSKVLCDFVVFFKLVNRKKIFLDFGAN